MKITLHERIRSDFESAILSGELAPGDRLPTEQQVMERYACSRMTANKALTALASAGLIERRKKAGTFVARPKVNSMVLDVPDISALVRAKGQTYEYRPLARLLREPSVDDDAQRMLAGEGKLLQLDGMHLANGVPLGLEYRLVSAEAVPELVEADLGDEPPGTWLLHHVPWTEAETRIGAVAASPAEARQLGLEPRAACLFVERRTWRGTERITQVRQIFVAGAYELVARFGAASGG